jgi:hypothetical protein
VAGAAAGVAAASVPHCALRKSFQLWLPSEPSALATLYLALHSVIDSALAGLAAHTLIKPAAATAKSNLDREIIACLLKCKTRDPSAAPEGFNGGTKP